MRVLHIFQPMACRRPPWGDSAQRSDVPASVISRMQEIGGRQECVVIGPRLAAEATRELGAMVVESISPPCGSVALGSREISRACRAIGGSDPVIGWGVQFANVLERGKIRGPQMIVDLKTGTLWARSPIVPQWHKAQNLVARVNCKSAVTSAPDVTNARVATVGLWAEEPDHDQLNGMAFVLGVIDSAGKNVVGLVRHEPKHLRRLSRHLYEGGRVREVLVSQRPLMLEGADVTLWVTGLPRRLAGQESAKIPFVTLLGADLIMGQGGSVLASLPSMEWLAPNRRPRVLTMPASHIARTAHEVMQVLDGHHEGRPARSGPDIISQLQITAFRLSQGQRLEPVTESGELDAT